MDLELTASEPFTRQEIQVFVACCSYLLLSRATILEGDNRVDIFRSIAYLRDYISIGHDEQENVDEQLKQTALMLTQAPATPVINALFMPLEYISSLPEESQRKLSQIFDFQSPDLFPATMQSMSDEWRQICDTDVESGWRAIVNDQVFFDYIGGLRYNYHRVKSSRLREFASQTPSASIHGVIETPDEASSRLELSERAQSLTEQGLLHITREDYDAEKAAEDKNIADEIARRLVAIAAQLEKYNIVLPIVNTLVRVTRNGTSGSFGSPHISLLIGRQNDPERNTYLTDNPHLLPNSTYGYGSIIVNRNGKETADGSYRQLTIDEMTARAVEEWVQMAIAPLAVKEWGQIGHTVEELIADIILEKIALFIPEDEKTTTTLSAIAGSLLRDKLGEIYEKYAFLYVIFSPKFSTLLH